MLSKQDSLPSSLLLDVDAKEELYKAFPTLQSDGYIPKTKLREAIEILGFHLAGYEVRDLETELLDPSQSNVNMDTLMLIQSKVREKKDFSRTFKQNKVLKESADTKSYDSKDHSCISKHSVSTSEERGYIKWINRSLHDDEDCKPYLPITDDLYEKCKDGIILCKLINNAVKDTIDMRILNRGPALKSVFKKVENLVLAINSAEAIGCCVVNIGQDDILEGTKHLVLGLIWQIIRIGLLSLINLNNRAELVVLLRDGETLDDLRQLSPEEILLRWVNYQLEKAGIDRRITNFKDDICDSVIYTHLLNQIAPDHLKDELLPPDTVISSKDLMIRATRVLDNAEKMDVNDFIIAEDICNAKEKGTNREKLHLAFVANLFNCYPALEMPDDAEIIEETLEEKTYRNWMNSMGVTPYVKDLYSDLRNGLVLLQLLDILQPGMVKFDKIVRTFDPKKKIFQMQANCSYVVQYAKQINLKVVNLSGEDLRQGEKKLVLGLCFQLMRTYTLKMLDKLCPGKGRVDDKDIVAWANKKLSEAGKSSQIVGFKDASIATAKPIIDLVDAIRPGSVDYSLIANDNEVDAKFAISMARKIGARVYALPQHLVMVHQKMVMTVFACLMVCDLQITAKSPTV